MIHSIMHFSLALTVTTCALAPSVLMNMRSERKHAIPFAKWILASYAAAIWSVVPNLLRQIGASETFCSGWWMNIFMLHPLLDRLKNGGMLIGELLIVTCFVIHYTVLLSAVYENRPDVK